MLRSPCAVGVLCVFFLGRPRSCGPSGPWEGVGDGAAQGSRWGVHVAFSDLCGHRQVGPGLVIWASRALVVPKAGFSFWPMSLVGEVGMGSQASRQGLCGFRAVPFWGPLPLKDQDSDGLEDRGPAGSI